MILTGGGIWNAPAQNFSIGNGNATGNILRLEGGSATITAGNIYVGDNTPAYGNSLLVSGSGSYTIAAVVNIGNLVNNSNSVMRIDNGATCTASTIFSGNSGQNSTLLVTNGSSLIGGAAVTVGSAAGGSNSAYIVDGSPGYSFVSNGLITVGSVGNFGRMTVANAPVNSAGVQVGGAGSIGASLTVNSNVFWDAKAGVLTMGSVATLSLNPAATLTNVGGISMVGANVNLGTNSLTLAQVRVPAASTSVSTIGNASSSNTLTLLPNTTWASAGANQTITVGLGNATGNVLRLSGGGIVGGVQVTNFNIITVGNNAGAVGNVMTVDGGGVSSGAVVSTTTLNVGGTSAQQSSLIVTNGGMVVTPTLVLGANATNNTLLVTGSNSFLSAGTMYMGSNSAGNVFTLNGISSTATVGRLVATNSGAFNFYAGVLNLTNSIVTNGVDFVVGDGAQAATLNVAIGGMNSFAGNLVVTNKATLAGGSMIQGTTTVYGTLSPGPLTVGVITNTAGIITNVGPFTLKPTSSTRIDMVSTNGPSGWDTLVVTNGNLTLDGTLTVVTTPGLALSNQTFVIMNNAGSTVGGTFASGGTAQAYNSTNLLRSIGTFNVAVSNNQYVVLSGYSMTIARRGGMIIIR